MKKPFVKAQHYRDRAEKMRMLAALETNDEFRKALLDVAENYERLSAELLTAAKRVVGNKP